MALRDPAGRTNRGRRTTGLGFTAYSPAGAGAGVCQDTASPAGRGAGTQRRGKERRLGLLRGKPLSAFNFGKGSARLLDYGYQG